MEVRNSAEDYLEMMLMLRQEKGYIRSVDIAEGMGVTKPSVSYAVKRLKERGYIVMQTDGIISLTEAGEEIALRTYQRHMALTNLLMTIGVSEETACEDACKIEHDLSEESFNALLSFAGDHLEDLHLNHKHVHRHKE